MHHLQFLTTRARLWFFANLCGVALYLHNASSLWLLPGDEDNPGGPGDAFNWVLLVLPVLFLFMATNMAALAHLIRTRARAVTPRVAIWLLLAGVWLCAYSYDSHRSRIVFF